MSKLGKVFSFIRSAAEIAVNPTGSILKKVLGVDLPDDKVEEVRAELQRQAMTNLQAFMEQDKRFQDFMLAYEGAAADVPKVIRILRGSVRPVITYLVVIELFVLINGFVTVDMDAVPGQYWMICQIVLGFWFGGRAVEKIISTIKTGQPS